MKERLLWLSAQQAGQMAGVTDKVIESWGKHHGLPLFRIPSPDKRRGDVRVGREAFFRWCLRYGMEKPLRALGWSPSCVLYCGRGTFPGALQERIPFPLRWTEDSVEAGWMVAQHEPNCVILDSAQAGKWIHSIAAFLRNKRPWVRLLGLEYGDFRSEKIGDMLEFDEVFCHPFDVELIAEKVGEGAR